MSPYACASRRVTWCCRQAPALFPSPPAVRRKPGVHLFRSDAAAWRFRVCPPGSKASWCPRRRRFLVPPALASPLSVVFAVILGVRARVVDHGDGSAKAERNGLPARAGQGAVQEPVAGGLAGFVGHRYFHATHSRPELASW